MVSKILKYKLEFVVFVCGGATMILELVGSRVIAPYFGNSLFVWTGLIGVVLGCMSLGYYFGGKLADKNNANERILSLFILFSGVFIGFSAFYKEVILLQISNAISDIRIASLLSVFILLGVSSVLLAMVSPYSAKIRLDNLKNVGSTVGRISSLSTVGSIVGTFLAGFFLIPFFGNANLLYFMALLLILLSLCLDWKIFYLQLFFVFVLALLFYRSDVLKTNKLSVLRDIDTMYNRIIVNKEINFEGREIVTLINDNSGIQTAVYADGSDELVADYLRFFDNADKINPKIESALMIGGAGYSYPRHFLSKHDNATIDVVEIDPKMVDLAKEYFFLKGDNPRINNYLEDARVYVRSRANTNMKKYDVVYLDAFNSITPPYYLTTQEFFSDLSNSLGDNGFVVINMISAFDGEKSQFLKSEYKTLLNVFPKIEVFPMSEQNSLQVQNIILIAYKNPRNSLHLNKYIVENDDSKVLTDDHAPVEYMTRSFFLVK